MNLKEKLSELPNEPGVYKYYDKDGRLLYVGKAKVLKNRVKSYFKFTPNLSPSEKLSPRIYKMITEVENFDWIVVKSEHDALILENSLIKQLLPKYNILLRDDKTYPYIFIDYDDNFPRLEITRKIKKSKNIKYFGPYSSGSKDILDSIYELVPLVQKKSCSKGNKSCLFYQIKKCLAPCEAKITKDDYLKLVNTALDYLQNKTKLLSVLKNKMLDYVNDETRFEDALILRDKIKSIEKSQIKTAIDLATNDNIDVFAIAVENKKAVVVRMFIRNGKIASSSYDYLRLNNFEEDAEFDFNEAYTRIIINYYNDEIPILPKEILISSTLEDVSEMENFLYNKFNKRIKILNPKKDKKLEIINIALNNCNELLRIENSKNNNSEIYSDLKKLFNLNNLPNVIESFDNSHMMGQATVGAMIVWNKDIEYFDKKLFRHYNLESKDEYSQMKEMLTRRINNLEKTSSPDLWIIDGGKTLLKLAYEIIQSYGANIDVIAISKEKIDAKSKRAKGSAKDIVHYLHNNNFESLSLKTSDKRLQFIQKQRDEAHRFAINFHKKQKRKQDKQISLLSINGIGEAKIKKLLLYFGSFEKIKLSSFEELSTILNEKDAKIVSEYFTKDTNGKNFNK